MTAAIQLLIARLRVPKTDAPLTARDATDWPAFWQRIRERLAQDGYRTGTLRLYRHVLRDLRTFLLDHHHIHHPGHLTRELVEDYLLHLTRQNVSWSWLANVIAVLRNSFDRLGHLELTVHMVTHRRLLALSSVEGLAGHNIREVQDAMGHRSMKTTLRYQACILPTITSPLDPDTPERVLRQMNGLLGRLAMTLPSIQPTKQQGT